MAARMTQLETENADLAQLLAEKQEAHNGFLRFLLSGLQPGNMIMIKSVWGSNELPALYVNHTKELVRIACVPEDGPMDFKEMSFEHITAVKVMPSAMNVFR